MQVKKKQFRQFIQFIFSINSGTEHRAGEGGVVNREQRSSSRSQRGGVSENQIAVATAARLFFLTAVAIAIVTRPFKFHEISVSNTSSSFVSSIQSFALDAAFFKKRYFSQCCGSGMARSNFFHPGSRVDKIPDPDPHQSV